MQLSPEGPQKDPTVARRVHRGTGALTDTQQSSTLLSLSRGVHIRQGVPHTHTMVRDVCLVGGHSLQNIHQGTVHEEPGETESVRAVCTRLRSAGQSKMQTEGHLWSNPPCSSSCCPAPPPDPRVHLYTRNCGIMAAEHKQAIPNPCKQTLAHRQASTTKMRCITYVQQLCGAL